MSGSDERAVSEAAAAASDAVGACEPSPCVEAGHDIWANTVYHLLDLVTRVARICAPPLGKVVHVGRLGIRREPLAFKDALCDRIPDCGRRVSRRGGWLRDYGSRTQCERLAHSAQRPLRPLIREEVVPSDCIGATRIVRRRCAGAPAERVADRSIEPSSEGHSHASRTRFW